MNTLDELIAASSSPRRGGPLEYAECTRLLALLPGWNLNEQQISRRYAFDNFHQTMAFVNAVAWIAHAEDHHPDLLVGYGAATVTYQTHSVGGLSLNDFICAAKVNALMPI